MANDFNDAGFTANVAFDLTKFNFRDLANGSPAFSDKSVFYYLYNKTASGIDYLQFSSEKADIKYLKGIIPISGTIDSIFQTHYTIKTNEFSNVKYYGYDLNLKVSDVLAVVATPKDLSDDARLLAKVFGGNDVLTGSDQSDVLAGFAGNDYMHGNAGDDVLYGDAGENSLFGDAGKDKLFGGNGVNYLEGGAGKDFLSGKDGTDWAVYTNAKSQSDNVTGITASLSKAHDNKGDEAAGDTYADIENLMGSRFKDKLTGNDGRNILQGDAGADFLKGKGGGDVFVFGPELSDGTFDTIADFKPNSSKSKTDLIGLSQDYFDGIGSVGEKDSDGLAGINSKAFHAGKTNEAHDADDRLIYNSRTGELYYDRDGNNGVYASAHVAHLNSAPDLTAASFRVVDFDLLA